MQRNTIEQDSSPAPQEMIPAAEALDGLLQTHMSRGQAIGALSSVIALSLVAVACRGETVSQPSRNQRELGPVSLSDNELVNKEIARLEISFSQKERDLFEKNWFSKLPLTDEQETFQKAARRVDVTLAIMRASENPYFHNAATLFFSWIDQGKAGIEVSRGDGKSNAIADLKEKDGKLFGQISLDFKDVAYSLTPLTLALSIVHEIEHLKNFFATQDRLLETYTTEERLAVYKRGKANPQLFLEEEARGYAAQARAFIYAQGLLRYNNTPDFSVMLWAGTLLRTGNDANNPAWRNYVATILPK